MNYHNITPPELMAPWDNHLALGQLRAQGDLRLLAPRAAFAIADSAYNEAHLAEAGFRSTAVVPPSAGLATTARTGATAATRAAGGGARWLAVGRVSPNKALESTVAALAVARAHHDPGATLRLVGKPATGSYVTALRRYVADLGLADAVTSPATRATTRWRPRTPRPTCSSSPPSTRDSASRWWRPCRPGSPSSPSIGVPCPRSWATPASSSRTRTPTPWPPPSTRCWPTAPRREALAEAGARRLAALDLDTAADRFVGLVATLAARGAAT